MQDRFEAAPVTVIGLGLMGQALAGAFLDAGHLTTVWNRSAAKCGPAVARGARQADSVQAAVTASPLVIVCVSDYAAVREILEPAQDGLPDRVLVNLTTGTAQEARDTAEWATRRGIAYLDGVILADPPTVGTPDAVLLYSGPQAAFDAHAPTLRSLGAGTSHLGVDPGLSSLYDMAMLTVMWSLLNGFLHGAALVGTAGVDAAALAPVINRGIGMMTEWLTRYADQVDRGEYPATDATIDTHRAAMDHLVHETEALAINAELPLLIRRLADRAVARGDGHRSYAAMIEEFRGPSGQGA